MVLHELTPRSAAATASAERLVCLPANQRRSMDASVLGFLCGSALENAARKAADAVKSATRLASALARVPTTSSAGAVCASPAPGSSHAGAAAVAGVIRVLPGLCPVCGDVKTSRLIRTPMLHASRIPDPSRSTGRARGSLRVSSRPHRHPADIAPRAGADSARGRKLRTTSHAGSRRPARHANTRSRAQQTAHAGSGGVRVPRGAPRGWVPPLLTARTSHSRARWRWKPGSCRVGAWPQDWGRS
jgi:hypothetical protein